MTAGVAADTTRQAASLPGHATNKRDHLTRLARIEGQVRGIARMVDEDRYCIDVLTQLSAASWALNQVALGLLDEHLRDCVSQAGRSSARDAETNLAEINRAVALALRL